MAIDNGFGQTYQPDEEEMLRRIISGEPDPLVGAIFGQMQAAQTQQHQSDQGAASNLVRGMIGSTPNIVAGGGSPPAQYHEPGFASQFLTNLLSGIHIQPGPHTSPLMQTLAGLTNVGANAI